MNHTPHTPAAAAGTPEFFLEVAERIGRRVAGAAEWRGEQCTWTVMSPDRERPEERVARPTPASGTLYEGTSGIALFLAELAAALGGDAELERAAVGGLRFALDEAAGLPPSSYGLHGGRTGIAYAAARAGLLLGRDDLRAAAVDALRPIEGNEAQDRGLDVIAGGGGAIPALLALAEWVDDGGMCLRLARAMGDHLVAAAEHETHGWAWGTMRGSAIRHLCGYAHGSAGIGQAFLELWHATGDSSYLYAAEQAFLYERQFFSPEHDNWPDLRHTELGELLYQNRTHELRERVLAGDPPPPQPPRFMSAWCHGAPGIGLTRLRAWQLTGDPLYLDEARAALRGTEESLRDPRMNYSLCHGRAGNAETPLVAAAVLGDPALLETPRRVAMEGWDAYEGPGRDWSCGTMGAVADPGLLLGEAGIGYFYLRLARPQTPSILLVTAPRSAGGGDGGAGYAALAERTAGEYFGRTLRIFRALGAESGAGAGRAPGAAPVRSDVEAAAEALEARVAAEDDPARRELLEDAFRLDRERFGLSRAVRDFTDEFIEGLARSPDADVRWGEVRIALSPRARVVQSAHDWDAWLEEGAAGGPPDQTDTFHLVQVSAARAGVRKLSPFAALVLKSVEQPATLDEVVAQVEDAVSSPGAAPGREWLEERVVEQLRQAYRAGFVTIASGIATAAA